MPVSRATDVTERRGLRGRHAAGSHLGIPYRLATAMAGEDGRTFFGFTVPDQSESEGIVSFAHRRSKTDGFLEKFLG